VCARVLLYVCVHVRVSLPPTLSFSLYVIISLCQKCGTSFRVCTRLACVYILKRALYTLKRALYTLRRAQKRCGTSFRVCTQLACVYIHALESVYRALYTLKRALYTLKRALYTLRRDRLSCDCVEGSCVRIQSSNIIWVYREPF